MKHVITMLMAFFLHPRSILTCNQIIRTGVNEYDKQIILNLHNQRRQAVALGQVYNQPPASDMMEMKWDNELANTAQKWANDCSGVTHDPGRNSQRFLVGQNIYKRWTTRKPSSEADTQPDFPLAIDKWFNEFKLYRFGKPGEQTGHYTQMIWAKSHLVGCGYNYYIDPRTGYTKKYVCNYGPSGNIIGENPYQKSYPNCPQNGLSNSNKYSGLCQSAIQYAFAPFGFGAHFGFSNYVG